MFSDRERRKRRRSGDRRKEKIKMENQKIKKKR